jgi:prophage regulatory protein
MKPTDQLLTIREVVKVTRLSKPTVYKLVNEGHFPRQVHLVSKRVAWLHSEILGWVAEQSARRPTDASKCGSHGNGGRDERP